MSIASLFYSRNYQNSVLSTRLNYCLMIIIKIHYFWTINKHFMKNRRRKLLLHLYIVNKILWLSALFLSKASVNTPLHSCCSAQQHVQTDTYLNITPGIRLVKSNDMDFFCTKHLTVDAARLAGSGLCHLGRLPGNPCVLRTHASTTLSQSFARPG